jgi:ADP-ribose pyrophosphatase YjhB (NUDIX family)
MKTPRTILITNNALFKPGGTEWVVRDLSLALKRRGRDPIVFSPHLGAFSERLAADGIEVVDDLVRVPRPPDLIHGHHHMETMMAVQFFPGVPALYHCHGYMAWQEVPPVHPRILGYAAIGPRTAQFVAERAGVPVESVRLIRNYVDAGRFAPRPTPLPDRPRRAVIYCHSISAAQSEPIVEACAAEGIACDTYASLHPPVLDPETRLAGYDIVFAVGKSALEAMSMGVAVVTCIWQGLGEMITSATFDAWRDRNFGSGSDRIPVEAERVRAQLRRYDARDARAVCARVRREATLERFLADIDAWHVEILARADGAPPSDPAAERAAAHAHLRQVKIQLMDFDKQLAWHHRNRRQMTLDQERMTGELEECRVKAQALEAALRTGADTPPPAPRRGWRLFRPASRTEDAAASRRAVAWIRELQAIAQTGRHFAVNPFDRARYDRLAALAAEMWAARCALPAREILDLRAADFGYATPRVDVRGAAFRDGRILLVREVSDGGRWTLPGGWADVNEPPSQSVTRELREESGFESVARKLIAVHDRDAQGHTPPHPYTVYKLFFLCEITGGEATPNDEASEIRFFGEDEIPERELSPARVNVRQLRRCFAHFRDPSLPAEFD